MPRTSTMSSTCSREPAIQSMLSAEWCTAWKRQSQGTTWNSRWIEYSARSATIRISMTWSQSGCDCTRACRPGPVEPGEDHRRGQQGEVGQELHGQVADEEMGEVGHRAPAEHALLLAEGEQPLHGHEHRREDQQGQHEPVQAQVEAAAAHFPQRNLRPAQQHRQQGQGDAGHLRRAPSAGGAPRSGSPAGRRARSSAPVPRAPSPADRGCGSRRRPAAPDTAGTGR